MFASIGGVDELLFRALNLAGTNATLDVIMVLITTLGGTYILALFAIPLWLRGQREATFDFILILVLTVVVTTAIKYLVDRSRPCVDPTFGARTLPGYGCATEADPSPPSGHASPAFAPAGPVALRYRSRARSTAIAFGASIFIAPYMTSRAPSGVAAIVAKLSTCVWSGRTQATGTPERETIAGILAPVRELKSVSNFRSAWTATGTRLPPNRLAMQPSLFSSCSGKTGCTGLEENTARRQVGLEPEDVTRGHPCREELDFQPRLERCGERAFVEAGNPGGNRLHPDFMRLRDGRGHQIRAERGVKNAAGPDRTVSLDHGVADGLAARPRLKEPRPFDGREEVALVG